MDNKEHPFVIVCFLLASMGTGYGVDPMEAKITNPPDGSIVLKAIEVELALKNISQGTRSLDFRISP